MKDSMGSIMVMLVFAAVTCAGDMPTQKEYTNSIGIKFVRIEAGTFKMGQLTTPLPWELMPHTGGAGDRMGCLREGDFDERPVHTVTISRPFYMAVCEVTNFQYELFDPEHRKLRGEHDLSKDDDEPAIYVSWYDAQAFCQWLSDKQGLPYRLPTEAEWEYACRAGTTTNYYPGDVLPKQFYKNQHETKCAEPVSLRVGQTPPNPWGLYDMQGNIEEWCIDWYGPYKAGRQIDPVGYTDGQFRVTRGGSHGTQVYALRSANRMAALPETRNWVTGFRVVLGPVPSTTALPVPSPPLHQQNVIQRPRAEVTKGPDPDKPYFKGPRRYVKIPRGSNGPLFATHNHDPAIVECPNGDLIAMWYTCDSERNRELGQAASRLRRGANNWEPASPFFDVPDRNDHAPSMGFDGADTIYHFTGVSFAGEHACMALAMRTSKDSGATWTKARFVMPEFNKDHMPSEPVLWLKDGTLVFAQDGRHTLWMSRDAGLTWTTPGGTIRGNHPSVVEFDDGRLLGLGRGSAIDGKMPMSVSHNLGKSFTYSASEFPPIGGGQRLVLMKLRQGPIFLASFANNGTVITDSTGQQRKVYGLFTAVSTDQGRTWPYKRLVTDDGPGRPVESLNGGLFTMSSRNAEYRGYLAGCQSLDGLIHLISSSVHYTFNLKWLLTPPPAPSAPPIQVQPVVETFTGPKDFDAQRWFDYKSYTGGFNGQGQYTINSTSRSNGLNRIVGTGSFEATFAVNNIRFAPPAPRTEPCVKLGFKEPFSNSMFVKIMPDRIGNVALPKPPHSAKVKFIWNKAARHWQIFYGLDGAQPVTELPLRKQRAQQPLGESTSACILVDHGGADIDYFEIRPL